MRQGSPWPVVVFNVSKYRSDALVVRAGGIAQVPLPGLDPDVLSNKVAAFIAALADSGPGSGDDARQAAEDVLSGTLEWLWDAVAEPVLRELGHASPHGEGTSWRKLWLVPGGLLSVLPLHAAGYHREGAGRTLMDRVVASYSPTIRALAHARRREVILPPDRSLVVAMPTTPGQNPLPGVTAEAAALQQLLPSPTLLIEQAGTVTERTPTHDAVLERLSGAGIAHFTCHASSHPDDPSQSLILLHDYQDKPLTVASLVPLRLERAQLAFLSACETALNSATGLADESIHLASAFHLAGYPHVIGSLWPIYDSLATTVARDFYTALATDNKPFDMSVAALALHHAVRHLRDGWSLASRPSLWAAYTHTGA
jgi:CHAT domain-containing protein